MPDEASTPPVDTQAPPSEPEQFSSENLTDKPVSAPVIEPTPPPEAAAPAPEPESPSQSETETGTPNTPTTPSVETDTPPRTGGEETPAPEQVSENLTGKQAEVSEAVSEPVSESATSTPAPEPTPKPQQTSQPQTTTTATHPHGDLIAANAKIQATKRKRLDKIMAKLSEKGRITNDEVEKLLRVSDATATRYLQTLEQENRIKQNGSTGTAVFYEKI